MKIIPPFPPLVKGGRGDYGITLIELIVAISIAGILVAALAFEFQGWIGSYQVESQIKEMYVDLMNARARAMQKNRMHFVSLTTTQYTINEDISTWPDGDENLTSADNTRPTGYTDPIPLLQKNLNPTHPITWNGDAQIDFTKRGLSNDYKTVCIFTDFINNNNPLDRNPDGISDNHPDYDCIVIAATRISIGKIQTQNTAGGACNSDNCNIK